MNETEKKAWREMLNLWKVLASTDYNDEFLDRFFVDFEIQDNRTERRRRHSVTMFRIHVLEKLGYEPCKFGSPFCKYFFDSTNCPLGRCGKQSWNFDGNFVRECCDGVYNYGKWEYDMMKYKKHNREYALKFYRELVFDFFGLCYPNLLIAMKNKRKNEIELLQLFFEYRARLTKKRIEG